MAAKENHLKTLEDFRNFAAAFAKSLSGNELVLLSGPMGAGKTEFVGAVLRALSYERTMAASPTYAFHHVYSEAGKPAVEHWDLYRIKAHSELEGIGLWDSLKDSEELVIIEWPERVNPSDWPRQRPRIHIKIEVGSDQSRFLSIDKVL